MTDPVLLTIDNSVATLTLNRPKTFNAMNLDLVSGLTDICIALAMDDSVRALVITGAGKAFCSGGDLPWMLSYPGGPPAAIHALAARLHQSVLEIRRMSKPVIAAVNGVAAGAGFSLALICDFRVIAESAKLIQAYTSNGLAIDGGGTHVLPRMVGFARALEIAAFDQQITAAQALEWGLVTRVAPDTAVLDEAKAMAEQLAQRSNHAYGITKRLLLESFDTPLETQLENERTGIRTCSAHPDGQEGINAFKEKRKPVFHQAF